MGFQGQQIGVAREEPEKGSLPGANDRETAIGEVAIQGFEKAATDHEAAMDWRPVSDRQVRVGIAGYGVCNFGAAFHFQDHPNVTVAAVAEIDQGKCAALARACRCTTEYSSCEELIKDDSLEAIFVVPPMRRATPAWPSPRSKPASMSHRPCPPSGRHWRMRKSSSMPPRRRTAAT